MRLGFGILFAVIIVAMAVCARIARHSGKQIGFSASFLLASLILPMAGNGIIILSGNRVLSLIGCYMYYLGLDVAIAALLRFTVNYCQISWRHRVYPYVLSFLLLADMVQLLLNPLFHHAFEVMEIEVDGFPYFKMIPYLGQSIHRVLDYLILGGIIVVFIIRTVKAPKLRAERYWVILFALVLVSVWETAYIFSGAPIDRSMIGFGVFGLLVFYFSLYYRPMRLLDRMLSGAVSAQGDPMYFFDDLQRCIWMNRSAQKFLNLGEQDLDKAGNSLEACFGSRHPGEPEWKDSVVLDRNGEKLYVELSKKPLYDSCGKMNGFYIHVHDLTDELRASEEKLYVARHDTLTGLYNRDYLYSRTREVLQEHPDDTYLIIQGKITDLKVINDLYGNSFGDYVLNCAANWLRTEGNLPPGSVFGRLGGDSFGICIPEKVFSSERLERDLSDFSVDDGETKYKPLIHVGVYRTDGQESDMSVIYDRALLALERIKDNFRFRIAWYDSQMREEVLRNRRISIELGPALEKGQIRPWLQPIMNPDGKPAGAEALVRWIHPEDGLRAPFTFIPVLEKNGMIADVDRFIWRKACEILARWKREGKDLFISVNISPKDFYLMDVPAELTQLVREFGVEPGRLRLEITETVMMSNQETLMGILRALRDSGFCIEMDDFGSGYSSLNLLRKMPVDVLKIDMDFLQQSSLYPRTGTIIRHVISLAEELGIDSLTEGVETKEQYDTLMGMGCRMYQGYYFSKPMPVEDFERYLENR